MRPFVFHLTHRLRETPSFHLETFETAAEAMQHAQSLLNQDDDYEAVAVVMGDVQLARIERTALHSA